MTYRKPMTGSVSLCPLMFSWLTLFGLGIFGVPGPGGGGGGGLQKPPLHKSDSIDAIDKKLVG